MVKNGQMFMNSTTQVLMFSSVSSVCTVICTVLNSVQMLRLHSGWCHYAVFLAKTRYIHVLSQCLSLSIQESRSAKFNTDVASMEIT